MSLREQVDEILNSQPANKDLVTFTGKHRAAVSYNKKLKSYAYLSDVLRYRVSKIKALANDSKITSILEEVPDYAQLAESGDTFEHVLKRSKESDGYAYSFHLNTYRVNKLVKYLQI